MKENKEKELASGNEVVQTEDATPLQTHPNVPKMLKLVPPSLSENRKVVSGMVNVGNLPSRWGLKRAKVDLSNHGKALLLRVQSSLSWEPVEVLPSPEAPSSEAPPCPNLESSKAPPMSASYTLIRSETLA